MELVFNELSFIPLSKSVQVAENKFRIMVNTFKKAKEAVGFKNVLFPNNLSTHEVVDGINFIQFLTMMENKDLKRALITFLHPPYLDDLREAELEDFYSGEYEILDDGCPTTEVPFGFPIAHIKSSITISLNTHDFWKKREINLNRITAEKTSNIGFSVCNICFVEDVETPEFKGWMNVTMASKIEDKDDLIKYLGFSRYKTHFEDNFFSQLMKWKEENLKLYKYTLALMKDVELNPFTGGMGQTENLRNKGKEASKRITNSYPDGDRLSYTLENDLITFIACRGHYKFH